ncbi:MAG: PQQ-binding-like beta-propeller repeat protein, partial [Phycisphaeraceae bacterium]|nr:PQQ-binding-like beta-propeller repeat protein [Phycisphaeraceae bacterium]
VVGVINPSSAENPTFQSPVLVCADRRTGKKQWQVSLDDVDDSFDQARFNGSPVIVGDRILVGVQRLAQWGADHYLLSFDLTDGRLHWRRHLASAASQTRGITHSPPPFTPLVTPDAVFVWDSQGAIARIQAHNGQIQWLRTTSQLEDNWTPPGQIHTGIHGRRSGSNFGHMADYPRRPVLTAGGLLVPASSPFHGAIRLDPQTGKQLPLPPNVRGLQADQFINTERGLVAVGSTISLLDPADFSVHWQRHIDNHAPALAIDDTLLVPHETENEDRWQLTILDLATGKPHPTTIDLPGPGLIVPAGYTLVVADGVQLRGYMSWEMAQLKLRQRIASDPDDPTAATSLALVAHASGAYDAMLEGARAAAAALEKANAQTAADQPSHRTTFHDLSRLAQKPDKATVDQRRGLVRVLGRLATTADQEVTYHIVAATLEEDAGRIEEAADHYQAILTSPALARQMHKSAEGTIQVRLVAEMALETLYQQHGIDFYRSHAAEADRRLKQILATDVPETEELESLARSFPIAEAAVTARIELARRLGDAGQHHAAIRQLRNAWQNPRRSAQAPRMTRLAAEYYLAMGRPDRARYWLNRFAEIYPQRMLPSDDAPVDPSLWVRRLPDHAPSRRAAITPPLTSARSLPGRRLAALNDHPSSEAPVLVQRQQTVVALDPRTLQTRWEHMLPAADPQLLVADDHSAVLWLPSLRRLVSLDARTGKPTWPSINTADVLKGLVDQPLDHNRLSQTIRRHPDHHQLIVHQAELNAEVVQHGRAVVRVGPRRVNPQPALNLNRPLAAATPWTIAVTSAEGGLAVFDRTRGTVIFRRGFSRTAITDIHLKDHALALTGIRMADDLGTGNPALSGTCFVLDPLRGRPLMAPLEFSKPLAWSALGDGHMVVVANRQVTAYRLTSGEVAWRHKIPSETHLFGRLEADQLLIGSRTGNYFFIDIDTGQRQGPIAPLAGTGPDRQAYRVNGHWLIQTPMYVARIDPQGGLRWQDAITVSRKNLLMSLVGRDHVLTLHGDPRREGKNGIRLFLLNTETGRIRVDRQLGPMPSPLVGSGVIRHNHILLDTQSHVLIITGQDESDRR